MPPELRDPTDPREWLRHARSNLALAVGGGPLPDVLRDDLCFEAQQAAEKAIKAILVLRQVGFPKTHSLVELFALAESGGLAVPGDVREAGRLTRYAVRTRYPGVEDVIEEDYRRALEQAERVVNWAERVVGSAGP